YELDGVQPEAGGGVDAGLFGEEAGHSVFEVGPQPQQTGLYGGGLAVRAVEALKPFAAVVLRPGDGGDRVGDRRRVAGAGRLLAQRGDEVVEEGVVGEDQFVLGTEIDEQRLDRHVRGVGDLRDGDVVEAPLLEQPGRRLDDGGPGQDLLPLPEG